MALTKKDKAELAELFGKIVDDRIDKALAEQDGGERPSRRIVRPDDPPLPTREDLLGHALGPIFGAGVIRFGLQTYYDEERGQVIKFMATREDGAEMKPLIVSALEPFEDTLARIEATAAALPPGGVRYDPNDPSTRPLSDVDKDRIRQGYKREIDDRFRGRR